MRSDRPPEGEVGTSLSHRVRPQHMAAVAFACTALVSGQLLSATIQLVDLGRSLHSAGYSSPTGVDDLGRPAFPEPSEELEFLKSLASEGELRVERIQARTGLANAISIIAMIALGSISLLSGVSGMTRIALVGMAGLWLLGLVLLLAGPMS